jgi:phosphate transport system permease protein
VTVQTPAARSITGSSAGVSRARSERIFIALLLLALSIGILMLIALLVQVMARGLPRLSGDFVTSLPSRFPQRAGAGPALAGSLWVVGVCALFTIPVDMGAAIYLEEYARASRWSRLVEVNIANLAGVPSVIYGLLGLAVFVRLAALGRSVLAGGLTLALMVLPVVIIAGRESLRAVPPSIREGALALGATRWQTVSRQVLPSALPGFMTGIILAISRALGEAAPLITVGAVTYITFSPSGPLDRFTALPIQIFDWTQRPQEAFGDTAAAGIVVLLLVLLSMNAAAIFLRNRYQRNR